MKFLLVLCLFFAGCSSGTHITNEEIVRKSEYCRQHNTVPRIQYNNSWEMAIKDIVCVPPEAMEK